MFIRVGRILRVILGIFRLGTIARSWILITRRWTEEKIEFLEGSPSRAFRERQKSRSKISSEIRSWKYPMQFSSFHTNWPALMLIDTHNMAEPTTLPMNSNVFNKIQICWTSGCFEYAVPNWNAARVWTMKFHQFNNIEFAFRLSSCWHMKCTAHKRLCGCFSCIQHIHMGFTRSVLSLIYALTAPFYQLLFRKKFFSHRFVLPATGTLRL